MLGIGIGFLLLMLYVLVCESLFGITIYLLGMPVWVIVEYSLISLWVDVFIIMIVGSREE